MNMRKFEELFGNTPIENIEKIHQYISENYIPVQKIKDKIEEIKERKMDIVTSLVHNADEKIEILKKDKIRIQILQELLEKED